MIKKIYLWTLGSIILFQFNSQYACAQSNSLPQNQVADSILDLLKDTAKNLPSLSADLKIYPQPVADILNIDTSIDFTEFMIYSMKGELVFKLIHNKQSKISVRHLESGMYFYVIHGKRGRVVDKLIIQH